MIAMMLKQQEAEHLCINRYACFAPMRLIVLSGTGVAVHSRLFVCALPVCRTQSGDNCGYDAQYERDEEREMQAREEGGDRR